jgi:hypothetical protein
MLSTTCFAFEMATAPSVVEDAVGCSRGRLGQGAIDRRFVRWRAVEDATGTDGWRSVQVSVFRDLQSCVAPVARLSQSSGRRLILRRWDGLCDHRGKQG